MATKSEGIGLDDVVKSSPGEPTVKIKGLLGLKLEAAVLGPPEPKVNVGIEKAVSKSVTVFVAPV